MSGILKKNDHDLDIITFRKNLNFWEGIYFRPFPWRLTKDPYYILIAEVMLHRTQASQVEPIFLHFIKQYPKLSILASSNAEDLQKTLFSLGLRWRIGMIHKMAQDIENRFNGQVPQGKGELASLPGVSEYIASAVRCFAWNLQEALIDTNTVRIAGRLFNLEVKESSRRNSAFRDLLKALVDPDEPRYFNFALLDLSALICTKRSPKCYDCPVCTHCAQGTKAIIRHELNVVERESNGRTNLKDIKHSTFPS